MLSTIFYLYLEVSRIYVLHLKKNIFKASI
jgi:hypothetical protein